MKPMSKLTRETRKAIVNLTKEQKEELIRTKVDDLHNPVFNNNPINVEDKLENFNELMDLIESDETDSNRGGFKYEGLMSYTIENLIDKHYYKDLAYKLEIYTLIAPNIYLASYLLHDLINDIVNVFYFQTINSTTYGNALYDNWLENIRSKSQKIEHILKLLRDTEKVYPYNNPNLSKKFHEYENYLEIKDVIQGYDTTFKTLNDVINGFNNLKPDGFQFLKDKMIDDPEVDFIILLTHKHQFLDIMNGTITVDEKSYNEDFNKYVENKI